MISAVRRCRGLLVVGVLAIAAALPATASAETNTFSNATPFAIPDVDNAAPSVINVSGVAGVVTDVNVFVNGLSHMNPDDLEMLVQGPFGQTTVLMNDAGGGADAANVNVSFNDEAGGQIPDAGPVVAQGYRPSDYAAQPGLEPFISPAPPPPYGLTLAGVDGTSPNGAWTLYADDDVFNTFAGSVNAGWSISITSTDVPKPAPTKQTATPTAKKCKKKAKKTAAVAKKKCKKRKK